MSDAELKVLCEIRDLLLLIAEPQIAQRDKLLREQLRKIAGKSEKNIKAISLMDGSRTQATIVKGVPIDFSQLSRLVKNLATAKLLKPDGNPEIIIPVTESIFKE